MIEQLYGLLMMLRSEEYLNLEDLYAKDLGVVLEFLLQCLLLLEDINALLLCLKGHQEKRLRLFKHMGLRLKFVLKSNSKMRDITFIQLQDLHLNTQIPYLLTQLTISQILNLIKRLLLTKYGLSQDSMSMDSFAVLEQEGQSVVVHST
jgi:hypothetical protein